MSHIQQQRKLYAKNKATVMQHLKLDELQLHTMQYHAGIQYVEFNNPSKFDQDVLLLSPIFWKWWVNQWNLRDSILVPTLLTRPQRFDIKSYNRIHDIKFINQHPSHTIMEESFAIMVGNINSNLYAHK